MKTTIKWMISWKARATQYIERLSFKAERIRGPVTCALSTLRIRFCTFLSQSFLRSKTPRWVLPRCWWWSPTAAALGSWRRSGTSRDSPRWWAQVGGMGKWVISGDLLRSAWGSSVARYIFLGSGTQAIWTILSRLLETAFPSLASQRNGWIGKGLRAIVVLDTCFIVP